MEENTKYSDQNDNQGEMQDECQKPDSYQNEYVEEVRFTEQTDGVEMQENSSSQEDAYRSNEYPEHNAQSNQSNQSNSNYNNYQNNYQNSSYQNDSYQRNVYQNTGYPADTYQNDVRQGNAYQDNSYQYGTGQNGYVQNHNGQNGAYQNNTYQNSAWQNGSYQNNTYMNGAYPNNTYQNYGGNYQQYNGAQPYDGQVELEEPVKVSEWVLALVLMMIPCVNIIMMFVWAFSSTEKKSKSNFFKAYLIFFGISMGVMLLIWFAVVIFALTL